MKNNRKGVIGLGTVVIIALVFGAVFMGGFYLVKQTTLPPTAVEEITETGDCATAPSLSFSILDAVNPGTAVVTTGNRTIINGKLYGASSIPSTLSYGDTGITLFGLGSYLNTTVEFGPLRCGVNEVHATIYATDDGTIKVFNDEGNKVTDLVTCLGAVNQSESATTIQNEIKLTSKSDQSLGNLIVVIECGNTTEVDDILLSDGSHTTVEKVDIPSFHTAESGFTGNIQKAFKITANDYLTDGKSDTYTLSIEPESGQTIGADDGENVSITMYTIQWYIDTDGTFKYGIENVDGTIQYEDTFDYDYCITSVSS